MPTFSSSSSSSGSSKGCMATCFIVISLVGIAFNVASIVVAVQHKDDECQGVDKMRLDLATWLLVTGIVGLATNVVLLFSLLGLIVFDWEACFVPVACLTVSGALFWMAWFVVGVVLVARSNAACVDDATSLGVMSVIMLCFQGLAICNLCSGTKASN